MSGIDLLPITKDLYKEMVTISWLMFTPAFLLSCVSLYVKTPTEFPALDMIKRIFVTVALLSAFPEISSTISDIANALAERLSEKHALDELFKQLVDQGDPGKRASKVPFLLQADLGVAMLTYFSYAIAFIARYLMSALYHFFWSLLTCFAPLAILCNLFPGLSHITKNLFGSLIEISLWNVVWQVMGVMLLGLPVLHPTGANYFDAVCFDLLLAIGMIATPHFVHSFVRIGLSSPSALSTAAVVGLVTGPAGKAKTALKMGQAIGKKFNKGARE